MPGNIGPFYFFARLAVLPFGIIQDQAFVFAVLLHFIVTLPALLAGVIGLIVRPGRAVTLMISVIVPAKNAAKTLGECLQALLYQEGLQFGHDYEMIVVDDGSTDDTAEIAEQHGSESHPPDQSRAGCSTQCGCQDCQGDNAGIHGRGLRSVPNLATRSHPTVS